jgi:hypothetical protein
MQVPEENLSLLPTKAKRMKPSSEDTFWDGSECLFSISFRFLLAAGNPYL